MNRAYELAITAILVVGLPILSYAQDRDRYRCTKGDLTRRVEIITATGVTVPCEVHYYKDIESPGERRVLWRAANEEGYCEARAADFVERLATTGWNCGVAAKPVGAVSDETPEVDLNIGDMADDTEALAPAIEDETVGNETIDNEPR